MATGGQRLPGPPDRVEAPALDDRDLQRDLLVGAVLPDLRADPREPGRGGGDPDRRVPAEAAEDGPGGRRGPAGAGPDRDRPPDLADARRDPDHRLARRPARPARVQPAPALAEPMD